MGSVRIAGLTKRYGDGPPVLDGIDLDVGDGEFFTLLGPSGCGKTTLLRTVAGFMAADGGTIHYDRERIDTQPAHHRDIGMVFQDYAVFPHLTVRDNVAFGLRARRLPRTETEARTAEAVALVRLQGLEDRMPAALSGGQQQRVGIARALAIRPRLLLMDEPLSNLDAKLRVEMRDDIRAIQRRLGITTLYVTHDQEEALAVSDRICVLNGGRIEQVGTPYEVYRHPTRRFAASFVGTMNFLPAEIDADGNLLLAGTSWPLDRHTPAGPVEIAIRPEHVRLHEDARTAPPLPLAGEGRGEGGHARTAIPLDATIDRTTFLGREAHCALHTQAGPLTAVVDAADPASSTNPAATRVLLPFDRLRLFRPDGSAVPAALRL